MSLLSRVTALVTITSLLAAPAFANHGTKTATRRASYGHRPQPVRSLTLAFERLDVQEDRGRLVVDYRADKASFRNMKKLGIVPVLTVDAGRHRFDARLRKRKGTLVFDIGRAEPRNVTVFVSGASGHFRLDSLQLGRRVTARVVLPVDSHRPGYGYVPPPPAPAPLPWSLTPAVIQACGYAFVGSYDEQECLRLADRFAVHPGPSIRACDDSMVGDANALACVRTASMAPFDPTASLRACEAAFVGNPNELSCFAKAVTASFDMSPTIRACEEAFVGDFNALRCMDESLTLAWNPVPVIHACDRHTIGDAAALACLARS